MEIGAASSHDATEGAPAIRPMLAIVPLLFAAALLVSCRQCPQLNDPVSVRYRHTRLFPRAMATSTARRPGQHLDHVLTAETLE